MTTGSPTTLEEAQDRDFWNGTTAAALEKLSRKTDDMVEEAAMLEAASKLRWSATLLQSLEARIETLSEALEHIYCDCRGRLVGAGDGETRIVGTPSPAALEKARAALTPSNRDRM